MKETKYTLITGASRGIGRAIAIKLASQGYSIIINYASNVDAAQKTLDDIVNAGGEAELLPFDVCNSKSVIDALQLWKSRHEGEYISVIVNNAGMYNGKLAVLRQVRMRVFV